MSMFDLFHREKTGAGTNIQPGDIIRFGRYPFAEDGTAAPIEWIVLGISAGDLLLISRYCLDTMGFCGPDWGNQTPIWERSYIRNWLNTDFYSTAFREEEKQRILETSIFTDGDPFADTRSNRVFLLSREQAEQLFPTEEARQARPTPYALKRGARPDLMEEAPGYVSWWVLPCMNQTGGTPPRWDYPQAVYPNGKVLFHSRNIAHVDFTVRPAIRLRR